MGYIIVFWISYFIGIFSSEADTNRQLKRKGKLSFLFYSNINKAQLSKLILDAKNRKINKALKKEEDAKALAELEASEELEASVTTVTNHEKKVD